MNSAEILYKRFGVVSKLDGSGQVWFHGLGKVLAATICGDGYVYEEASRLMADVEKNARDYLQYDNQVILRAPRQIVVLTPTEIMDLLKSDPDLYVKALKRGKSVKRIQATERRR